MKSCNDVTMRAVVRRLYLSDAGMSKSTFQYIEALQKADSIHSTNSRAIDGGDIKTCTNQTEGSFWVPFSKDDV